MIARIQLPLAGETDVVESDRVIYELDGRVREVRPVGRYTLAN
ncbi:MAG: hypothetical protein AB7G75_10670 [Candidatus Binatia bacterium]